MADEPTLDSILSGEATAQQIDVDEPEGLITDPVENKIGTEQVEGQSPDDAPEASAEAEGDKKVGAAFKAQRETQAKRYTEQVADFQQQLAANNAAWEQRFQALLAQVRPPQQQTEAPPPPDFFADPRAAVQAELAPVIQAQLAQREAFSGMIAMDKFGEEAVNEAYNWLAQRKFSDPAGFAVDYPRIMSDPHPYGAMIRAYRQSQTLSEIGNDPNAYRERLKAEILAELNPGQGTPAPRTNGATRGAALPSNFADARTAAPRSGPGWSGPPSLREIFKT